MKWGKSKKWGQNIHLRAKCHIMWSNIKIFTAILHSCCLSGRRDGNTSGPEWLSDVLRTRGWNLSWNLETYLIPNHVLSTAPQMKGMFLQGRYETLDVKHFCFTYLWVLCFVQEDFITLPSGEKAILFFFFFLN